jgi:shikimate kinase
MRRLLPQRQQWYEEVADVAIDTDGVPVEQLVDEVLAAAERAGSSDG